MRLQTYNSLRKVFSLDKFKPHSDMKIKAALVDLSGTLHIEDEITPNAITALERLRQSRLAVKFVTNTTKDSSETLLARLHKIGFNMQKNEIYSSLNAAANYVEENGLNPFYIVSEDARKDFPQGKQDKPFDSVVIGLAIDGFTYANLNKAFSILMANKEHRLIAIHQGKYYRAKEGMALGPGCFVKGLEYSTGQCAVLIGKPNRYFFESAIPKGITPEECVMIGDDPTDDISGAMQIGLRGIQVKTGKYLPNVVIHPPPTALVENFEQAVDWILENLLPK